MTTLAGASLLVATSCRYFREGMCVGCKVSGQRRAFLFAGSARRQLLGKEVGARSHFCSSASFPRSSVICAKIGHGDSNHRQQRIAALAAFRATDRVQQYAFSKPQLAKSFSALTTTGDNNNLPSTSKPIDFQIAAKIEGEESHVAIIELRPGETLRAESGAMLFMTEGVVMDTKLEGASAAFSRMLTGQNVFLTDFRYEPPESSSSSSYGTVGLGTDFPSKIMRFSLEDYPNSSLICQRGAYLASNPSVNIEMEFTKSFTAGFFGGQGFVLQKLHGSGDVLVKGGGTIVRRDLDVDETLRVTSGSIVAFESTIQYDVQMMPGIKNAMFGGEGLFVTTLKGPGSVWLQGMPADRMIAEIARRVPSGGPGIGIPIGVGGSGGGVDGTAEGAGDASDAVAGGDESIAAAAATESAIDADRQATVASSGFHDNVDSESQSALFGDAVPMDENAAASNSNVNESVDPASGNYENDDFTSFSTSSTEEPKFDESSGDFESSTFDSYSEDTKDGEIFDDTASTDSFDTESPGSDGGSSSIISSLWDFFTGGDD